LYSAITPQAFIEAPLLVSLYGRAVFLPWLA